ncbi:MAG: M23 family metallopeptidase [Flavobacteriaceae bacterium]|nr:M23 family metallopeptidase [Flavobacteriaceae bacterium]
MKNILKDRIKKKKLKHKLTDKYRLVMLNEDTFEERFSFKLSRLNVFVFGSLFVIFLIVSTSILIAFTSIKYYIPGYSSTELKKQATSLVYKVDSLQNVISVYDIKMEALLPVLKGEEKTEKFIENVDSLVQRDRLLKIAKADLLASKKDSVFRNEVESRDRFSVFDKAVNKLDIVFFAPVTGYITSGYNPKEKHYAVDISLKKGTPVKAVADGTVIFTAWTSATEYVIILEHKKGFLSVYKHNSVVLKQQGDLVKTGQVIAASGSLGELSSGPHLHFELWSDGYPVNPTNYISFE